MACTLGGSLKMDPEGGVRRMHLVFRWAADPRLLYERKNPVEKGRYFSSS